MGLFDKIGKAFKGKKDEAEVPTAGQESLIFTNKDGVAILKFGSRIIFEHTERNPFWEVFRGEVKKDGLNIKKSMRKVIPVVKVTYKDVKDGYDIEFNDKGYRLVIFARRKGKTLTLTFDGKENYEFSVMRFHKREDEILFGLGELAEKNLNDTEVLSVPHVKHGCVKSFFTKRTPVARVMGVTTENVILSDAGTLIYIDTDFAQYNFRSKLGCGFFKRPAKICFYLGGAEECYASLAEDKRCAQKVDASLSTSVVQVTSVNSAKYYARIYKENDIPVSAFIIDEKIKKEQLLELKKEEAIGNAKLFVTLNLKESDGDARERIFTEEARALYQVADGFLCKGSLSTLNAPDAFYEDCLRLIEREISEKDVIVQDIKQKGEKKYAEMLGGYTGKTDFSGYFYIIQNKSASGGLFLAPVRARGRAFKRCLALSAMLPSTVIGHVGIGEIRRNAELMASLITVKTEKAEYFKKYLLSVASGKPTLQVQRDGSAILGEQIFNPNEKQ